MPLKNMISSPSKIQLLFGEVMDQILLFQLLISRKKFHEITVQKQLLPPENKYFTFSLQRDQLSRGHEEIAKMDNRILELQERLTKKRCMNQQLANQISAATSAKQAQLRAIQQGMMNRYVIVVEVCLEFDLEGKKICNYFFLKSK